MTFEHVIKLVLRLIDQAGATEPVILPVANFSSYVYNDTRTANFVNLSANAVSYSWSFGDGSTVSTDVSPNHKYTAAGTYTITLTTTGIAASGAPSVKTSTVTIP
jgi:PKD repeat protein